MLGAMSDPVDPRLLELFSTRPVGVLATIKRDGRPQLSNVTHVFDDGRPQVLRISIVEGLAKTAILRRDPRASYLVATPTGSSYVVAEGTARLSPVATEHDDEVVEELVDVYRRASGEHPDWDDYRTAMVRDRRIVLTISVQRMYGLWQG
jgi:PPOX class probable F420-dependent enzyme